MSPAEIAAYASSETLEVLESAINELKVYADTPKEYALKRAKGK